MATSKFLKRTQAKRIIATKSGVGGDTIRIPLNRDFLIAEHRVSVSVSQAFTGVPTGVDVRDFISTISVESSKGRLLFLTGAQAYDFGRFTEAATNVVSTLGATSTAQYTFDIHYENDESTMDLLTALRSNELTTLDLVITLAPCTTAANGFKGGTVPLVAAFNVVVTSVEYQDMLGDIQFGLALGSFAHIYEKLEVVGTTVGAQPDIQLVVGNASRFISLHTYDTTGAMPVLTNAVLGNVRLNINGRDVRVTTGFDIQQDNVAFRGFNQTGAYFVDFGDDPAGWLNLEQVNAARLTWDVKAGAPAGYKVTIGQDYVRPN